MTDLIAINANIKNTMTSLEVAELTSKEHSHIMRDIRTLLEQGLDESNFGLISYKDSMNREKPMYELTKKGCLILASGYNALLREKIINRWEELETKEAQTSEKDKLLLQLFSADPTIVATAHKQLLEMEVKPLQQEVSVQKQQINELQPKASYYDVVINCKDLVAISTIAKDFGKSAIWMNNFLHQEKIQFKQGDIWLLYQNYAKEGYTSTKTQSYNGNDGTVHSKIHTYWTQKGRLFIYDLLKSKGFIPTIEQA